MIFIYDYFNLIEFFSEYELMPFGRGCPPGRDFTKKDCRKLNKKVPSLKYGETGNFNGFLPKCFLYGKKTVYYNKGGRVPPTKSKNRQKAICKKKPPGSPHL